MFFNCAIGCFIYRRTLTMVVGLHPFILKLLSVTMCCATLLPRYHTAECSFTHILRIPRRCACRKLKKRLSPTLPTPVSLPPSVNLSMFHRKKSYTKYIEGKLATIQKEVAKEPRRKGRNMRLYEIQLVGGLLTN